MSHYARALESIVLSDPADLLGVETEQTEQTEQTEPLSRVGYRAMGAPALGDPAELAAERTSQANYGAGLSPVVAEEEL